MDNKTDSALAKAGPETKEIVITGDKTLGAGDMERIAQKIKECVKLTSLTISDCGLDNGLVKVLVDPLRLHPSLTKLLLPGNNFSSPEFIQRIVDGYQTEYSAVPGNHRIHTVDLSQNAQNFSGRSYRQFLQAIFNTDHLAVLKLAGDPWTKATHRHAAQIIWDATNTLILDFDELRDERAGDWTFAAAIRKSYKSKIISDSCSRNQQEAIRLLDRVINAEMVSRDDVVGIRQRLPAILYLAEQKQGREVALRLLAAFDTKARKELNLTIDMAKYTPPAPAKTAAPVAPAIAEAKPAIDSYSIKSIMVDVESLPEAAIAQQIREGIDQPLHLAELGKSAVNAVGKISISSLHTATSTPTVEPLLFSMDAFLAKFAEAGEIIGDITGDVIMENFLAAKADLTDSAEASTTHQRHWWSRTPKPKTITDTISAVEQSVGILKGMSPEAETISTGIAEHLAKIYDVIGAYGQIADQLHDIRDVGGKVVAAFREEFPEMKGGISSARSDSREYHLDSLVRRLDFLRQVEDRVKIYIEAHTDCAYQTQQQVQNFSVLLDHNIPLLAEEVGVCAQQLKAVAQQSSNTRGDRGNMNIIATAQTMKAVDSHVSILQASLRTLGEEAYKIRGQLSQLFSSPVTFPSLPATNRNDAVRPIPQPR